MSFAILRCCEFAFESVKQLVKYEPLSVVDCNATYALQEFRLGEDV